MEVFPLLKGSQAKPTRGCRILLLPDPSCTVNAEALSLRKFCIAVRSVPAEAEPVCTKVKLPMFSAILLLYGRRVSERHAAGDDDIGQSNGSRRARGDVHIESCGIQGCGGKGEVDPVEPQAQRVC